MVGGWSDKTKVILNSTQFKFKLVEVGVELGNYDTCLILAFFLIYMEIGRFVDHGTKQP